MGDRLRDDRRWNVSDGSKIEWCTSTWTIAVGCTRVDARCEHCYAIPFVHRKLHASHEGLTKLRGKDAARPGVDWNGIVRTLPERLADPLRWKKPRRIFVGSMTDLFHPAIPFEYIAAVFGVMAACPHHTFLVLTKRPERAREFFAWVTTADQLALMHGLDDGRGTWWTARAMEHAVSLAWRIPRGPWPLPNVHIGVSVSDQTTADGAIPVLLELPAAVRWVSYEPALGPVVFDCERGWLCCGMDDRGGPHIDTIVVGGESGPSARPFHIEWARDVISQCRDTNCKVYVKQMGSQTICMECNGTGRGDGPGGYCWGCGGATNAVQRLSDRKGGDMSEWPSDLRIREWAR